MRIERGVIEIAGNEPGGWLSLRQSDLGSDSLKSQSRGLRLPLALILAII